MKTSFIVAALWLGAASAAQAQAPRYTIVDLGVLSGTTASQAFGISPNGASVVGRALGTQNPAYLWTAATGMTALPNLAGRNFAVANGVNNAGTAVGTSATTSFGSGALPVRWQNGAVSPLPLPAGVTLGRANAVNASGTAVGSINGGSTEVAAIYAASGTSVITATTANGSFMRTAYGINDGGLVIGSGIDPNNAAVNVGLVYNSVTGTMTSVGALAGANGALGFGVSNSGFVVGGSMLNQGNARPFIWSSAGGIVEIALPASTGNGSARAVNDSGWAVGTAGGLYAVPFLYANGSTYTLADLLPQNSGWDLQTNTSSSALGISADGSIVGTGVVGGQTHAYLMMLAPVPEPAEWAMLLAGLAVVGGLGRRRVARRGA